MAAILVYALYSLLRPSVSSALIRTSVVDVGLVEETIPATGTILPAHEQIITSSIDSRVIALLRHAGDKLNPGDQILLLDTSEILLSLERTSDNLTLKENERNQTALELEADRNDLEGRRDIKKLEADLLASKTEALRKLSALGGATGEQVDQAELEEKAAAIRSIRWNQLRFLATYLYLTLMATTTLGRLL